MKGRERSGEGRPSRGKCGVPGAHMPWSTWRPHFILFSSRAGQGRAGPARSLLPHAARSAWLSLPRVLTDAQARVIHMCLKVDLGLRCGKGLLGSYTAPMSTIAWDGEEGAARTACLGQHRAWPPVGMGFLLSSLDGWVGGPRSRWAGRWIRTHTGEHGCSFP